MRSFGSSVCVAVATLALLGSARLADGSDVKVVSSENFDQLTSKETWLVEFYAPWCGHCKRLAPVYEEVATALVGKVNVAKCDATVERGLAARFPVGGYPAMFVIHNHEVYEYNGKRNKGAIVDFATTGWKSAEALGFLQSPFSPIGKTKGVIIAFGSLLLDFHEYLYQTQGFSQVTAGVIVGGIVLVVMMAVMFIVLTYCFPPPQVRQFDPNRLHRD